MRSLTPVLVLAALFGVGLVANGIVMLVSPAGWYAGVPGVPATGPFNQHFLRDIGLIFVLLGGAFLLGVVREVVRTVLWGAAAVWLTGHAAFHVWEVLVGICGPSDLLRDFPAVSLPAIVAVLLTLWSVRDVTRPRAVSSFR